MAPLSKKQQKFTAVYDQYAAAVHRHVRLRVGRAEDAEDITAQCFMKTWEYLAAGKMILQMKPFLFRVANNLIIDWYRAKNTAPLPLEEIEDENEVRAVDARLDEVLDARASVEALERALSGLEPAYRDVIVLSQVEGMSASEIAEKLAVSANVVYVRLHRGRKKLLELLSLPL
ncbi:MAG: RNA polymerase sigma factor [Candidatus Magasanikbacteria bacterium]|nr:RNA polymerase sigma factor [Candidatus Magasanikbacteria bacterium]